MKLGGLPASTTYAGVASALAGATGTTTVGNPLRVQKAGVLNTKVSGLILENPTAATSGNPVQFAPQWLSAGSAWVSGALRTMGYTVRCEPRTSGHVDLVFEYDWGDGGGFNEIFRITTSEPNTFAFGVVAYRYITSGGGLMFQNNSGVFRYRNSRSGLEVYSASSDDPAEFNAEAALRFSPRMSDGGPILMHESGANSTIGAVTATVVSFTPPANCRLEVDVTVEADSAGDCAFLSRRRRFAVSGGAVTPKGSTQTIGTDDIDAPLAGAAADIAVSGGDVVGLFAGVAGKNINAGGYMSVKVFEV